MNVAASTKGEHYSRLPRQEELKLTPAAAYVHMTSNNTIEGTEYGVIPLRPHPEVASKAFRLVKHGDEPASYDVSVQTHGPQCECKGFLRWGHCKHLAGLIALREQDRL